MPGVKPFASEQLLVNHVKKQIEKVSEIKGLWQTGDQERFYTHFNNYMTNTAQDVWVSAVVNQ